MSNKFQPWSEIEDETLLQELEENISISNIAINHKRTYNAITTRIWRIAYQLVLDNTDVETILEKTKLSQQQLYACIKRYSTPRNSTPISKDNTLRFTYSIIFHFNNQEILREDSVSYNLMSYCENNCMNVVNSERIKKEFGDTYCFCNIRILNNKNIITRETVNIQYPFKRVVDSDDLLTL